ncbi:MAG: hypothetical protein CMC70_11750 [Flavobacteriaceae bacterium]|nr:hypothetical protein [Flavobacteriaceae bacterium]|tara:strand:+ start:4961 stop:9379 length:4419 start_codon:yes stop_codon:yes gene_type:complete
MADGNLVRQSNVGEGSVVFGPSVYDLPLLPFEKELIKTIGITEKEYRKFAAEVKRRGAVRPAEYAHIPDIQATGLEPGTVILINLAISLVLGGVAYLLTPKPKMPEASKRSQLDLGSVNAGNRFTQSRGFDTLNELADYGAPIPIIFGLYNEAQKVGGMLVTPKLVWSRMFSHGTQQSAKLMFVVGEQGFADDIAPDGISVPDLEGIFLGNNALDVIHEDFFAFYWKKNTTTSLLGPRIKFRNKIYGTTGSPDAGDPAQFSAIDDDAFMCPSNIADNKEDFCHAYSPSNNTQFGMFAAIPNGNGYRVNYETVSIIDGTENSQAHALTLRRMKIVGDKDRNINIGDEDLLKEVRKQDQEGEGRQYSPRMGLVRLIKRNNGGQITVDGDFSGELKAVVDVRANDQLIFQIDPSKIDEDKYQRSNNRGGENVDDINSTVIAEQLAADDAMQIGERFAIGNTLWKVTDRKLDRYEPDDNQSQFITLRCLDSDESRQRQVGLVSLKNVIQPSKDFIADGGGIGAGFFPLTRISTGLVRNNRPAVVTEIGFRSKVFQRLNGLCSFNSVPTPGELDRFEDEEVTVRSGTYTGTIKRSSVFQVFVRQAGLDENGNAFIFQRIDEYFVVTGSKPVDQYNFLRFTHPNNLPPTEFEYKFVSIPASELRGISGEQTVYRLSASISSEKKDLLRVNADVPGIGRFVVAFNGIETTKKMIALNKEFTRGSSTVTTPGTVSKPQGVSRSFALPQDQPGNIVTAEAIEREVNISNSDNIISGKNGAFFHTIFGSCDNDPTNEGGRKTIQTREILSADKRRWMAVKWTVEKARLPEGHYARNNGATFTWAWRGTEVVGSSDGYSVGDQVEFKRGLGATSGSASAYPSSNPFVPNNPGGTMTFSGHRYRVTDTDSKEFAIGKTQGYYYEVFGNAANLGVGQSKTIIRNYPNGPRKIKVQMTATVRTLTDHFSGETQGWNHPETITVDQGSDTTSNWNEGDTYDDLVSVSSDNPFITSFLQVGFRYSIGNVKRTEAQSTTSGGTEFESQSQYADLSLYRGLVQKSNESEPEHNIVYVNEIVPNEIVPLYNNLTIAGLSLKASRNFTSLDQMRVWLGSGLHVKRLHPDLSVYDLGGLLVNGQASGPSNLFTDLVFYLLTNQMGGAGGLLKMDESNPKLLNQDDFVETSRFLHAQKLFFNGVVGDKTNLRQYITDAAPYFLCNFVIMDGKFSLKPAIPHMADSGLINLGPVPIEQLFTAGNILEDSYKLEYLRSEERRPFKAVMRYRQETKNKLPEEKVVEVKLPGQLQEHDISLLPQEQFDLTQFCTSEDHAIKVAKYFLGIRKLVSHTISFSTTVHGLSLRAGSYIKVITEATPYSAANTGTVNSSGVVTSVSELADGEYNVSYFKTGSQDVEEGVMQVSGGIVADSTFHDTVFTIKSTTVSQNVYVVEQLTFSQEGTVDIVASEHPCDDDGVSELAKLIAGDSVITVRS